MMVVCIEEMWKIVCIVIGRETVYLLSTLHRVCVCVFERLRECVCIQACMCVCERE